VLEFLTQPPPRLDFGARVSFPLSLALHVAVAALLVTFSSEGVDERIKLERPREVVLLTAPPPELYRALPAEPKPPPISAPPPSIPPPAAPHEPTLEQPEGVPPKRARLEVEPFKATVARAVVKAPIDAPQLNESSPPDGLVANLQPPPRITKPRLVVQEAGFAGLAAERGSERERTRLTVGLFGSPEAASGSATDRPAGKIVTAGFGTVAPAEHRASPTRTVQRGRFTPATAGKPAAKQRSAAPPETSSAQPVRVLSKPTPVYTEQARALRIEGETTIEALFRADGTVEVLRVVRALGYGLDDNAVAAARAIRFEPARRDSKPVDSVVQIRIRFEIAY